MYPNVLFWHEGGDDCVVPTLKSGEVYLVFVWKVFMSQVVRRCCCSEMSVKFTVEDVWFTFLTGINLWLTSFFPRDSYLNTRTLFD